MKVLLDTEELLETPGELRWFDADGIRFHIVIAPVPTMVNTPLKNVQVER